MRRVLLFWVALSWVVEGFEGSREGVNLASELLWRFGSNVAVSNGMRCG